MMSRVFVVKCRAYSTESERASERGFLSPALSSSHPIFMWNCCFINDFVAFLAKILALTGQTAQE